MAELVKYIYGTEAQILALTPESPNWKEKAFYYPSDKTYFYQALNGSMKKYGDGLSAGIGITLNNSYIAGVKSKIDVNDVLDIPEYWEYNLYELEILGFVNCNGTINIMD